MAINPMSAPIDYLGQMGIRPTDPGTALLEGLQLGAVFKQQRQMREQEQLAEQYKADASAYYANPTPQGALELARKYPEQGAAFMQEYRALGAEQRKGEFNRAARALSAVASGRIDIAKSIIDDEIKAAAEAGGDTSNLEMINAALDRDPETAYASMMQILAVMDPEATSSIADALKKARVGGAGQAFSVLSQQQASELGLPELSAGQAYILDEKGMPKTIGNPTAGVDASNVQSSQILEDGTTVSILKNGERVVRNALGDIVQGQEAADAITAAQERGAELQGIRAGERTGAVFSQRRADAAFGRLEDIRGNIADLQEVNRLIDEGADTGVIASKLPNWRASTIALKTARNRLGLNVVGSVTFGALSEAELALALETALPTNLDDADLKDWVNRKIAAQEKLADYLEQQVVFLSEPGKSQADWLKFIEEKGAQGEAGAPPAAPSGFKIIRAE
jgi:hypothetical protein